MGWRGVISVPAGLGGAGLHAHDLHGGVRGSVARRWCCLRESGRLSAVCERLLGLERA